MVNPADCMALTAAVTAFFDGGFRTATAAFPCFITSRFLRRAAAFSAPVDFPTDVLLLLGRRGPLLSPAPPPDGRGALTGRVDRAFAMAVLLTCFLISCSTCIVVGFVLVCCPRRAAIAALRFARDVAIERSAFDTVFLILFGFGCC